MPPDNDTAALDAIAEALDAAFGDDPVPRLVRIVDTAGAPVVSERPLDDPISDLLSFTAPASWTALGLRFAGRARPFSSDHQSAATNVLLSYRQDSASDDASTPVTVTVLLDRSDNSAGIMRHGSQTTELPDIGQGQLGDTMRRVFGLPTHPAPPNTVEFWIRCWLGRLADSLDVLGNTERYSTWPAVADLHPNTGECDLPGGVDMLVSHTRRLAEDWPWSRLRENPDVVVTPCPAIPHRTAQWMDDGMYARTVLTDIPTLEELADYLQPQLPDEIITGIAQTVTATGLRWPTAP